MTTYHDTELNLDFIIDTTNMTPEDIKAADEEAQRVIDDYNKAVFSED